MLLTKLYQIDIYHSKISIILIFHLHQLLIVTNMKIEESNFA